MGEGRDCATHHEPGFPQEFPARMGLQQSRADMDRQERREDESIPRARLIRKSMSFPVRRRRARRSVPDWRPASQCDAPRACHPLERLSNSPAHCQAPAGCV
jgi:hypothetical protein